MLSYHTANKRLKTENALLVWLGHTSARAILAVTLLLGTCYANNTPEDTITLDLTPQDKSYINALEDNTDRIPAWLLAQLLPVSKSLANKLQEPNGTLPLVELNELLADPARYRGQVIAIRTLYAKSSNVNELLQLASDEQAWSALVIDAQYHHAIQLFTSQDPSKFQKSQAVYAIGLFLTTRLDRPQEETRTQSIVVPVIIGTLMPMGPELPPIKNKNIFNFLAPIILLTVIYIFMKIYSVRSRNMKSSLKERFKKNDSL